MKIDIRLAKASDFEDRLELIREFREESLKDYNIEVKPEQLQTVFKQCLANTLVVDVDGKVVGTVAGVISTLPQDGSKVYQEIIWYVKKNYRRYGVKLLKGLETFCREKGIKHIIMIAMANLKAEKLSKFYKRLGFMEMETHYIKNLEV